MKKILFICFILLVIHQNIFCQNRERKWTVQISPFLLFSDIFVDDPSDELIIVDFETQYKVSNSSNISLTLSFLYNDRTVYMNNYISDTNNSYKVTYYQIGFKPMYIHRPFETGLRGFFIGVYPNLGFRFSPVDEKNKFFTEIGFGFNLGYKWIFRSGLTMQLGGGIGKTFSIPPKTEQDAYINSDGRFTIIRTDLSLFDFKLGYSF
jgi:hypothetical protein